MHGRQAWAVRPMLAVVPAGVPSGGGSGALQGAGRVGVLTRETASVL
jgi:hypothetical protein